MFTGIIECTGKITSITQNGTNTNFELSSPITGELKPDQSVAHNGVCLTVTEVKGGTYKVTAVRETLEKTNLTEWKIGDEINLERALKIGDRLDGHFVQGHVDTTGICIKQQQLEGSWLYTFHFPENFSTLIIEKGSVCINGISLTAFNVNKENFTVTIIPYTFQHTNFQYIDEGSAVNLEFDILGKYLLKANTLNK